MTKAEFLTKFREEAEVKFDESIVSAHPAEVAQAVWHSLEEILPTEETIIYGVQKSPREGELEETLTWFLVLSNHVLELAAEQEKESVRVTHRYHLRDRLSAKLEFEFKELYQPSLTLIPREVKVSLMGEKQPIEIRSTRSRPSTKAICRFAKAVMTGQP